MNRSGSKGRGVNKCVVACNYGVQLVVNKVLTSKRSTDNCGAVVRAQQCDQGYAKASETSAARETRTVRGRRVFACF